MKIVITHDNGTELHFQGVTDYYVAVRTLEPKVDNDGQVAIVSEVKSFSGGGHIREIVKEISQSVVELQDFLRNITLGKNIVSAEVLTDRVN